jgi:hypothetical protein
VKCWRFLHGTMNRQFGGHRASCSWQGKNSRFDCEGRSESCLAGKGNLSVNGNDLRLQCEGFRRSPRWHLTRRGKVDAWVAD